MRQINDRLDAALKSHIFDLIEEQGEDHRNQHIQKKLAHGDDNRIGKNLRDVFELKHILKIFQSNEFGTEDSLARVEILKGHDDAEHGNDIDENHPDQRRDHHDTVGSFSGLKDILFLHKAFLSGKRVFGIFCIPSTLFL